MKRVVIESPYRGDLDTNIAYVRRAVRHSISLGEAPFASHLLYTRVLNDHIPEERKLGMKMGLVWLTVADLHVFYMDLGLSSGMDQALTRVRPTVFRWLDSLVPASYPANYNARNICFETYFPWLG